MKLRVTLAKFPSWAEFRETVTSLLGIEGKESSVFLAESYLLDLPEVIHRDISALIPKLGWTRGRLVSYYVLQGLMRVEEQGDREKRAELHQAAMEVVHKAEETCVCPCGEVSAEGRVSAMTRLENALNELSDGPETGIS